MVKEEGKQTVVCSQAGHRRFQHRQQLTFKKRCKDDFITINVSGRRFQAEDTIFERYPGKSITSI